MSNKLRLALLNWGPVVFMLVVFGMESQQAMGAEATAPYLQHVIDAIFGHIRPEDWMPYYGVARKVGHFSGYGLFSAVFYRALYLQRPPLRLWTIHFGALLATLTVASLDEWHQTYLPGRTGCPEDVLIDMCGATLVQIVLLLVFYRNPLRHTAPDEA